MKINGKELKDIIKDGVLSITDSVKSLKVRNKSSYTKVTQSNNKTGGDVVGGNIISINDNIKTRGAKFGNIDGSKSSFSQRIWIDGEEIESSIAMGITSINVTGDVETVDTQGEVIVGGDVTGKIETQGKVEVAGNVNGDINTQGKVECKDVKGSINTMDKVECGKVGGNVETMGKVIINS